MEMPLWNVQNRSASTSQASGFTAKFWKIYRQIRDQCEIGHAYDNSQDYFFQLEANSCIGKFAPNFTTLQFWFIGKVIMNFIALLKGVLHCGADHACIIFMVYEFARIFSVGKFLVLVQWNHAYFVPWLMGRGSCLHCTYICTSMSWATCTEVVGSVPSPTW